MYISQVFYLSLKHRSLIAQMIEEKEKSPLKGVVKLKFLTAISEKRNLLLY